MAKTVRNSKIAKQTRARVKHYRDYNKILIRESIRDMIQPNAVVNHRPVNVRQEVQDDGKMGSREQLRRWALSYNVSKRAVTALLKILISLGMTWLPRDSRSLFETPRQIELFALSNGRMWYNGIERNLQMIFANLNVSLSISLCINMDGLPVFNSSKYQFCPILARVFGSY